MPKLYASHRVDVDAETFGYGSGSTSRTHDLVFQFWRQGRGVGFLLRQWLKAYLLCDWTPHLAVQNSGDCRVTHAEPTTEGIVCGRRAQFANLFHLIGSQDSGARHPVIVTGDVCGLVWQYFQILRAVIVTDSVDVVDHFSRQQSTAQFLLSYKQCTSDIARFPRAMVAWLSYEYVALMSNLTHTAILPRCNALTGG